MTLYPKRTFQEAMIYAFKLVDKGESISKKKNWNNNKKIKDKIKFFNLIYNIDL
jgi:hypothetical protein